MADLWSQLSIGRGIKYPEIEQNVGPAFTGQISTARAASNYTWSSGEEETKYPKLDSFVCLSREILEFMLSLDGLLKQFIYYKKMLYET